MSILPRPGISRCRHVIRVIGDGHCDPIFEDDGNRILTYNTEILNLPFNKRLVWMNVGPDFSLPLCERYDMEKVVEVVNNTNLRAYLVRYDKGVAVSKTDVIDYNQVSEDGDIEFFTKGGLSVGGADLFWIHFYGGEMITYYTRSHPSLPVSNMGKNPFGDWYTWGDGWIVKFAVGYEMCPDCSDVLGDLAGKTLANDIECRLAATRFANFVDALS